MHVLTYRHIQVLSLACEGMTDKEIAAEIGISLTTVKSHWVLIKERTNAKNRTNAVAVALRAGLIE